MATIAQQLEELVKQKNQLVANLNEMGVEASETETLNSLVGKVLEVGGNIEGNVVLSYSSLTSVGKGSNVTGVHFLKGVTLIEFDFDVYTYLNTITFPDTATSIYASFEHNKYLTKISIPKNITLVLNSMFYRNSYIQEVVFMATLNDLPRPIGSDTYPDGFFENCFNLTSVVIGNVKNITGRAFSNCNKLESVVFKDGVESINGTNVFYGTILKSLTIPRSFKSFYHDTFDDITSTLTDIYYEGTEEEWLNISIVGRIPSTCAIHYNYTE